MEIKSVLIADDHPIVRKGILSVVNSNSAFKLIYQCGDGQEAFDKIMELRPNIVILDISMPGKSGIEIIKEAKANRIESDFIILTMYDDEEYFEEAMELGVKGYLLKDNALLELENCLKIISDNKHYICPSLSEYLFKKSENRKILFNNFHGLKRLTNTERQILAMLSENKTSKVIAEELFVSVRTIQNHRNNICNKLNLHGSFSLLEFAIKHRSEIK